MRTIARASAVLAVASFALAVLSGCSPVAAAALRPRSEHTPPRQPSLRKRRYRRSMGTRRPDPPHPGPRGDAVDDRPWTARRHADRDRELRRLSCRHGRAQWAASAHRGSGPSITPSIAHRSIASGERSAATRAASAADATTSRSWPTEPWPPRSPPPTRAPEAGSRAAYAVGIDAARSSTATEATSSRRRRSRFHATATPRVSKRIGRAWRSRRCERPRCAGPAIARFCRRRPEIPLTS